MSKSLGNVVDPRWVVGGVVGGACGFGLWEFSEGFFFRVKVFRV